MEAFKIYYVLTLQIASGKSSATVNWWQEKGRAMYESSPGVKSVKSYGVQFGLGGNFIEVWLELENYAAFDQIDRDLETNPHKYAAFGETQDLFESSSARVMGDWPESHWSAPQE